MMKRLRQYLSKQQRRELEDIEACADKILAQPLDLWFTDHTIAHPRRIESHLDRFLSEWAEREASTDRERLRAELFVLLAAVYLHDIGMQLVKVENCPSLIANCPRLVTKMSDKGLPLNTDDGRFSGEQLDFVRRYHHVITHDWLANANLRSGRDIFPGTGLTSYADLVGRVAWAHNEWLENEASYAHFTGVLTAAQEQVGEMRLVLLAAFLRMGDILDLDGRRVDVTRLRRFDIPAFSRAHWWRHHFVRTCRLDDYTTHEGRRLHLVFTFPAEHESDRSWLVKAIHSATVSEVAAEQERLSRWLWPAGLHIRFPSLDECEVTRDASGAIEPMPPDVAEQFRRIWPGHSGVAAQVAVREGLEHNTLTESRLAKSIAALNVRAAIDEYLEQLRSREERGFRDQPYTVLELDYGEFSDALDALAQLLEQPNPSGRPIVIVGDPGAGKSTLMRRYVLDCARGERSPGVVPLFIQANRYGDGEWARQMEAKLGSPLAPTGPSNFAEVRAELLDRLLELMAETLCDLAKASYERADQVRERLREVMARRKCLIVFDGLNELPRTLSGLAIEAVRTFSEEYRSHRIIVTSRVGDYHEDYFPDSQVYTIRPVTPSAVRAYWTLLGIPAGKQDRVLDGPLRAVGALASNPMYMYMLGELLLSGEVEHLERSGKLFRRFTAQMLRRWHTGEAAPELEPEAAHGLLAEIAMVAFEREQVAFTIEVFADAWERWRQRNSSTDIGWESRSLAAALCSTGLLRVHGGESFAFRHHTMQDYFAAEAIPHHLEELQEIVKAAIYREPLRILVGIIDDPNGFIRKVMSSTSQSFGRAQLLPLCFQIAGACPAPLDVDVRKLLLAGATPLFALAIDEHAPFAVEALAHLFACLRREDLAVFLAQLAKRDDQPWDARARAATCSVEVLNYDGQWDEQAIIALLDLGLPSALWELHKQAKQVLSEATGDPRRVLRVPLLLGGLAYSRSFSPNEKYRICHALGRCTLNQFGLLESILLQECVEWGRFAALSPDSDTMDIVLSREHYSDLLLHELDAAWLRGDSTAATKGYFDVIATKRIKHGAFARLVLISGELGEADTARLLETIDDYDGADLHLGFRHRGQFWYTDNIWSRFESRPIASRVRRAIEVVQQSTSSPWLIVFYDHLLGRREGIISHRFDELEGKRTLPDFASREGLFFLKISRLIASEKLAAKLDGLRSAFHPSRESTPRSRIQTLLEQPVAKVSSQLAEVIYEVSIGEIFLMQMFEQLDVGNIDTLLEICESFDRSLGFQARCAFLIHVLVKQGSARMHECLEKWGWSLFDIFERVKSSFIEAIGIHGEGDDVELAIHWFKLKWDRKKDRRLFHIVDEKDIEYLLNILERRGRYGEACAEATSAIHVLHGYGINPQRTAKRALKLCLQHGDPDAKAKLANVVISLLADRHHAAWAFTMLEVLCVDGAIAPEVYVAALTNAVRSPDGSYESQTRLTILDRLTALGHHELTRKLLGEQFVAEAPSDPDDAADYFGNGAWQAYLVGDDERFLEFSELALSAAPPNHSVDWILGNRAFALLLLGREEAAMHAYEEVLAVTISRERWQKTVLDDLQQHTDRRPGSAPIDPHIVDVIRALGAGLPNSSGEGGVDVQ